MERVFSKYSARRPRQSVKDTTSSDRIGRSRVGFLVRIFFSPVDANIVHYCGANVKAEDFAGTDPE